MRRNQIRAVLAGTAWVIGLLVFLMTPATGRGQNQDQAPLIKDAQIARQAYSDKVAASYNFAFGKGNISMPGNAMVVGNIFIQPDAFPPASYCGHCHQQAYHQWRQALHSNAFREPFYRTSLNLLEKSQGIEFSRHCNSCHSPIAELSGALTQNSMVDRKFDQDGLTCMTCHSIQKVPSELGNGNYVMGVPAVLVDAKGNRIPGIPPDSEVLAHLDRHSKAVLQSFYRTPEFCSACHKTNLPKELNGYKQLRADTAFDEWQNSKFSQRNPLTFYTADFTTCQNCHMKRAPHELPEPGAKKGMFASHSWLAGNTAMPFYYGFDEQLAKTIAFLKSGNFLNVDLFAIRKASDKKMIAPLGSTPFTLGAGDVVETMVVIQSKGIGHSLLPEIRDLTEAWLEFSATDSDGKEIYHSGYIKPDGSLDEQSHSFSKLMVDKDIGFVDNHKVATVHIAPYDNTIEAGHSALVRYEFQIPASAKGAVTITARVNYRHLRQSFLDNVLGKGHAAYPIVELASQTRTLNLGENSTTPPGPDDNPDWMRWNNLGIAYLDQALYPDAINAFSQVVKLRPDYADGYTNIGLTDIAWWKFASARESIDQALKLRPNNARALYYLALVERRDGHFDAEVADLEKVVEQYPQSRDARRELGVSYYQLDRSEDAVKQFKALQAIDPDDLAAHYNLAILYRRLDMSDQAKTEAAMYADKKADPHAQALALDFLSEHPQVSRESVPQHIYTNMAHPPISSGDQ
jgi:Flp pilus assembly protein TadD